MCAPRRTTSPNPPRPGERELLDRYVAALQANDIDGLIEILTSDATGEMPPCSAWFHGAAMIGQTVEAQSPAKGPGDHLLLPTAADGQPAYGLYIPDAAPQH